MSTLEKMNEAVQKFMTEVGLEAPQTIRLAQLAEDSKKWLAPDETNYVFEELFFKIEEMLRELAKSGE